MPNHNDAPGDEGARPHVLNPRQARWRGRNPDAVRAHHAVAQAKAKGNLIPQVCAWPGCTDPNTEAHHPSYERPLEVEWLCRRHHRAEHRRLKGMGHDPEV